MSDVTTLNAEPTRQLVGVLVTDLVASTALRFRLGDRVAEEVRRIHERSLRRIASRYGAGAVHWLGDGVLASFPSASAALQAAVAIQQANERGNRRRGSLAELAIRVGVGAGEVRRQGRDFAGPPVDEAVALCRRASGGDILVCNETLELIGSRIELDVTPHALETACVRWPLPRSAAAALGLPHALETDEQLPFVGRVDALDRLRRALEAATEGQARVVAVRGEAGIGKTRLAAELAREALERGAAVLFGACRADLDVSNAPVAHALRAWMEAVDDISDGLGPRAGELVRLVPQLSEHAPWLDPPTVSDAETERLRLYEAVGDWLVDSSLDETVLFILDSMHWGGPDTFRLLQHVLPMLEDSRVMILVMLRPEDRRADDLVRCATEALGPAAGFVVDLEGLDLGELTDLLQQVHDGEAQLHEAQLLHGVTRGNPLHLNEILRWPGPSASPPDTIHAAMRLHMERLEAGQRRVVESAAVLGSEFEAECLAEMTGQLDVTLDALDAGVEAGLLLDIERKALRYRFAHEVTRQMVIESIGAGRMARLHERAGMAIEAVGRGEHMLVDLARHFAAAAALGHRDKAVDYAARAAEAAAARYDNESAEALHRQAMELLGPDPDPRRWCDLAIGLGEALRRLGDPGHRSLLLEVADRAHEVGDGERMAQALITTYRGTFSRAMRVDTDYVERLGSAVELIGGDDSPTRARLLALIGVETAWASDHEENRRVMNEALSVARRLADPDLLATVLAHRQWTIFHPLAERLDDTNELAALAERCTDPLLRFDALGNEVFTRIRAGDRAGLDRAMERLRASAAEVDQPLVRWMLMIRESALALMEGRFDAAEGCIEEGRKLALATGQPDAEPQYIVQRFWLNVEQQPLDSARPLAQALAESYREMPPMTAWSSIAFRTAELGLEASARPVLAAMAKRGFETIPMDQGRLVTLCGLAVAAAALRDERAAGLLHALLEPHEAEHANVVFATLGSVARYLGLLCVCLGRHEAAEDHLRRAIAANREIGAVTWLARSQLDYVECRLERGAFDAESRGLLHEATSSATRIGLPTVLERAQRLADRVGTSD